MRNKIFFKINSFVRLLLWPMLFISLSASATTYTLPANFGSAPFSGCTYSSGITYNCNSSITIPSSANVVLTSSIIMNLSSGAKLSTGSSVSINSPSSGYTLQIISAEDMSLGNGFTGNLNITTTNGQDITIGSSVNITGNLTSSGNLTIQSGTVNGVCTPTNSHCTGSASVPTVTTNAATGVTSSNATLNGTVSSNGSATTVTFNYGTTTGYGTTVTASQSPLASTASNAAVSATIAGLTCGTLYHFRVSAANSSGTTNGSDVTFTTTACVSYFSAYETSISNASAATPANRIIQTRLASTSGNLCKANGTTCSLTVAGFTSAGVVSTTYGGTVNVSLQYCTNVSRSGSGPGSTVSCGGTWADLTSVTTQSVTLASGVGTITFPFANNSYEVVRVKITSASVTGGPWYSDDYFSIRPGSLTITATDATSSTAGSTRSLTSGAYSHKAGQPFTLSAQALATATTTSNYPGTGAGPVVKSLMTTSPTGTGMVNGTISLGTWSGTGTVSSSTAFYSEVGVISLTLEDQDYANIDKSDGSTTTDRYFSGSAALSRFTPDHFTTQVTQGCVAGAYTYSGQPFTLSITALNSMGLTTANYDGSAATTPNYAKAITLTDGNGATTGGFGSSGSLAASNFSTGVATVTTPAYTYTTQKTPPSTVVVRATESTGGDSISSSGFTEGTLAVRSGRLKISNGYGSELLPLSLPMETQFWQSGGYWTTNTLDACTSLNQAGVTLGNYLKNLSAGKTTLTLSGVFVGGKSQLNFTKPGAGNSGSVDVTVNNTTAGVPWFGTPPEVARATFGIYKTPIIYMRENY